MIQIGDSYSMSITITAEMVSSYGTLVGDFNPIHFDAEYAKTTRFGKNIVHGMLLLGYFSNIVGNHLPGNGTIYSIQAIRFAKPVYINETVTFIVSVKAIQPEKSKITLDNVCKNQAGEVVMEGESKVYNYTPSLYLNQATDFTPSDQLS